MRAKVGCNMPALGTGQIFERYRIIQYLGSGVSGESYEAEDTVLLRKVTLRLIHPWMTLPDSARRQFFREMQGISELNHPYLAAVLDYGEIDGRLFVARRYVSSGSLLGSNGREWFHPPLASAAAIRYGHQLAQTLQYIHDRGYLHGSLTFSNILILRGPNMQNEPDFAPFLLADVGLTNFVRRFGSPQISLLPVSAAPEQLGKRVTPGSDQFALAVLLYFWLTGLPPYMGTPDEVEHLKLTETIAPPSAFNPAITVEQDSIILRALTVYPEERYPSALAFADALLATLTPETRPMPAIVPVTQPQFMEPIETPRVEIPEIEFQFDTETPPQDTFDRAAEGAENLVEPSPAHAPAVEESNSHSPLELLLASTMGTVPKTDPLSSDTPAMATPAQDETPSQMSETESAIQVEETAPEPAHATEAEVVTVEETVPEPEIAHAPEAEMVAQEVSEVTLPALSAVQPAQPAETAQEMQVPVTPEPVQPLPEPKPQVTPDVPQPLPEPDLPQPQPDPVPQPEPDAPQKPPEPELPSPVPDPVPPPAPDIPQPLPEPSAPPIQPGTLPQAESETVAEMPAPLESVTTPALTATPPQIDTTPVEQAPAPPETPVGVEQAIESTPDTIEEQPTQAQLPVSQAVLEEEQEQQPISPRVIITSPYTEESYEFLLEHDETNIGRAGSSDLLLEQDSMTSRHHALLRRVENRYLLYDRRSANGVYVNGQKLAVDTGYELADGDHITIGSYELIFRFVPDPATSRVSPVSQLI